LTPGDSLGNLQKTGILVVDPSQLRDGTRPVHGDHAAEVPSMIAIGLGFLVLFSILSIILGDDYARRAHPQDDVRLWLRFVAPISR
jgi:hypothetical protein